MDCAAKLVKPLGLTEPMLDECVKSDKTSRDETIRDKQELNVNGYQCIQRDSCKY